MGKKGSRDEREEIRCPMAVATPWIRHPWKKGGAHTFFCKAHHFLAVLSVSFVFYLSLSLSVAIL